MKKKLLCLLLAMSMCLATACASTSTTSGSSSADSSVAEETDPADSSAAGSTESADSEETAEESGNDYFESLNAAEVNIIDTGLYTIELQAKDGWQFDVADNSDVTDWLVDANGETAFPDDTGIATAVNGDDFTLTITLDASKISSFPTNGAGELYAKPTGGNPLVVEGDNKGQYTEASELVGAYTIPEVVVDGTIEGESGTEYTFTEDTVTVCLNLDGIDDSLIDSSNSLVALTEATATISPTSPLRTTL